MRWKSTPITILTILSLGFMGLLMSWMRQDFRAQMERMDERLTAADGRYEHLTRTLLAVPPDSPPTQTTSPAIVREPWNKPDVPLGSLPFDTEIMREAREARERFNQTMPAMVPNPEVEQIIPGEMELLKDPHTGLMMAVPKNLRESETT